MRHVSSTAIRSVLLGPVSVFGLVAPGGAFAQTGAGNTPVATTTPADAAAAPTQVEGVSDEIVVTGIRASQARSVEIKRNAASVVEAISAQDIGKLPDVTISDSLQRIPGVQIRREAGEGGAVNIRGLPQVTTLMNGEQFLGANSVTAVQPNFTDIPSQLFSGATVFKSPTASLQQAGLTGTIDLLTRRPFDLKNGMARRRRVRTQRVGYVPGPQLAQHVCRVRRPARPPFGARRPVRHRRTDRHLRPDAGGDRWNAGPCRTPCPLPRAFAAGMTRVTLPIASSLPENPRID